uniref:Uncharacterized protein n=1 Tax=Cannabis sativa TaxID=3483 RepID=A0A803P260_CANSA
MIMQMLDLDTNHHHRPYKGIFNYVDFMIRNTCILESEWLYFVALKPDFSPKTSTLFVYCVHANLVVAGIGIYECEEFMTSYHVHLLINPWQQETIFRACFVKVGEVDASFPLSIQFRHQNRVGYPNWVESFPNKVVLL